MTREHLAFGRSGLVDVRVLVSLGSSLPAPMARTLGSKHGGLSLAADMLPAIQRLCVETGDAEAEAAIGKILNGEDGVQFPYKYGSHLLDIVLIALSFREKDQEG